MTARSIYQRARWRGLARTADSTSWREFCLTVVDRIEAIRATEAPTPCPTCGSTADAAALESKWCPGCQRHLARTLFGRRSNRPGHLKGICRACSAREAELWRRRAARRRQPSLLEVTA